LGKISELELISYSSELPKDQSVKTAAIPLLQRRGGRDLKKISPKASLILGDGVVGNVF
jgi:hypothetical protein